MAVAQRALDTDWVFPPASTTQASLPKEREGLLRDFYQRARPIRAEAVLDTKPMYEPKSEVDNDKPSEIIAFPIYEPLKFAPSQSMWAIKEWDGRVTSIGKTRFIGVLVAVGSSIAYETELLEFPLSKLDDRALKNIAIGSIFRLSAGYKRKSTGQVEQHSAVWFRPKLAAKPKQAVEKSTEEIKRLFRLTKTAPDSDLFRLR